MRMNTALLSVVIGASFGMLGTPRTAHAVVVNKVTFHNTQVSVFAFVDTSIVCSDNTEGTASAGLFLSGGPTDNGDSATFIDVFNFSNSCPGGLSFGDAAGSISGGVIGPNHPLTSARLTGSGNIFIDNRSDMPVPVTLNLTFTGNGSLSVSKGTTETRTFSTPSGPFTITIQRGDFRNRTADVSGTITIAGVVFPLNVQFAGSLLDNLSTTITVTK